MVGNPSCASWRVIAKVDALDAGGDILARATRPAESGKIAPRLDPRRFSLAEVGVACALPEDNAAGGMAYIDVAAPAATAAAVRPPVMSFV